MISFIMVWLDSKLSIYLLEYSPGARYRSQDYSAEVSFNLNVPSFWMIPHFQQTGHFCPLTLTLFLRILSQFFIRGLVLTLDGVC